VFLKKRNIQITGGRNANVEFIKKMQAKKQHQEFHNKNKTGVFYDLLE
jgi:hypothetical protein